MSKAYFVCATPRSGSTLLCEALKATGVAGRPEEYFESVVATGRPPRPESYLDGLDDPEALALLGGSAAPAPPPYSSLEGVRSYAEHLERVREWGTTPNGVFGVKLMWGHVGRLHRRAGDPLELFGEPSCARRCRCGGRCRPRHGATTAARAAPTSRSIRSRRCTTSSAA